MTALSITIDDLRLVSEANQREHWRTKHRRKKAQQIIVLAELSKHPKPELPARITLTRIALRRLDTDNAAGSFKHVQDEIARWMGVDDGDERYDWQYRQEKGDPKQYAVRIEIE